MQAIAAADLVVIDRGGVLRGIDDGDDLIERAVVVARRDRLRRRETVEVETSLEERSTELVAVLDRGRAVVPGRRHDDTGVDAGRRLIGRVRGRHGHAPPRLLQATPPEAVVLRGALDAIGIDGQNRYS